MNKRELELWVDQEHGSATFVFNNALAPDEFPDGTPDTAIQALARLWGPATADLSSRVGVRNEGCAGRCGFR